MLKIPAHIPVFHVRHQTHQETLLKFVALVLVLAGYFLYITWKYDAATGFSVSLLTWSFFVLCTPVADGGFILAFPIRLLFGVRMSVTQIVVWFFAIGINGLMLAMSPDSYEVTFVTQLLQHILTMPYPYWSILILSAVGTLLSIYLGDEMMDVTTHKARELHQQHGFKYRAVLVLGLAVLTIGAYYYLLHSLGIGVPT